MSVSSIICNPSHESSGPEPAELYPSTLCRRYRLRWLLHRDQDTEYYAALDLKQKSACTIKRTARFKDERRLGREVAMLSMLSHPGIFQLLAFDRDERGSAFIVGEPLRGPDLEGQLQTSGPMPLETAAAVLAELTSAVQAAHGIGLIHRALQPGRFLLGQSRGGKPGGYKLSGLYSAKWKDVALPPDGLPIGRPEYLAPEATLPDRGAIDERSDQWSLAVIAYRMLSGVLPFQHAQAFKLIELIRHQEPQPLSLLCSRISTAVSDVIARALAKSPSQRFASVREFSRALTAAVADQSASPLPVAREYAGPISVSESSPASHAA